MQVLLNDLTIKEKIMFLIITIIFWTLFYQLIKWVYKIIEKKFINES